MSAAEASALTPAQRAQVAIRERMKGMGEVDIVKAWYQSEEPFDLTDREDLIRRRWDWAKAQFLDRKTYTEIIESLQEEFGISGPQARIDIRNMRHVFGPIDEVPKAAHRARAVEMVLKAYEIALEKKDQDGMTRAAEAYAKITGIDKDDPERFDLEKVMQDRLYVDVLDPEVRNLLLNFLNNAGGSADAAKFFETVHAGAEEGEFVDYEEMTQADDNQ
jgi:hypothetical protein